MTSKMEKHCGSCKHFTNEDALGLGWCALKECETTCGSGCKEYENKKLTMKARIKKTGEIKEINEENLSLLDYARGIYRDTEGNKYHWKELEFIEIDDELLKKGEE